MIVVIVSITFIISVIEVRVMRICLYKFTVLLLAGFVNKILEPAPKFMSYNLYPSILIKKLCGNEYSWRRNSCMVYFTGNSQLQPLLWSCVSGKVYQGSYILSFNSRGRQCTPCISYFAVLYSCTDVDTSPTADFIARVRRCELWPSKAVGCGMVYLNQE